MKKTHWFLICLLLICFVSCQNKDENMIDKITFEWSVAGHIPAAMEGETPLGLAGPVVGISNGFLLVGGGSNFPDGAPWDGGKKTYYSRVFVFRKSGDSIVNTTKNQIQLPYNVAYGANVTTDKGIVVVGGENESGALNKVSLINWDTAEQRLICEDLPPLPVALTSGTAAAIGHRIYFVGGQNQRLVSDKMYSLDLDDVAKGWIIVATLPAPVTHTVLYAIDDQKDTSLLLVGGRRNHPDSVSDLYPSVYRYDFVKKNWLEEAFLPSALSAFTGISYNGQVPLVIGGDKGAAFHKTEVLLMKIAGEQDEANRKKLIEEKNELQKSHPGFDGTILAYDSKVKKWEQVDSIPFAGQVTTTAVQWGNDIVIPGGEVRAGVRTADIILGQPLIP